MSLKHLFAALAVCVLAATVVTAAEPPLKALIIDGQNNHNWKESTPILKRLLEETGLFKVDVATSPPKGKDVSTYKPDFAAYNVVVGNYNGAEWTAETKKAFVDYVAGGGGYVCYHAACNPFRKWKEYNEIIAVGGWGGRDATDGPFIHWRDGKVVLDTSPGRGGGHGPQHPYQLIVREPDHPITKGLPPAFMHSADELYHRLRGPAKNVTVLATAFSAKEKRGTGNHEPMLMAIAYGKGRCFHIAPGHAGKQLKSVAFIVPFQRGTEWAASGKVTQKVPADFPTADKVSRREQAPPGSRALEPLCGERGAATAIGADWPTYNHDAARSGATAEALRLPLKVAWTFASPHPPAPSWPDPARHDYWHKKHNLNPRVVYDRAFHVAVAGDAVFFGSSADDRIVCLALADGKVRWTFFTEGPVRLAPTVAGGKVYAGSDDGRVYCLSASDGHLLWKSRPGPHDRRCIGNGRLISRWPVRTSVIVDGGIAYCAAGLLPTTEGVYLCALDAAGGRELWKQKINQVAQGYALASAERLYLPSGRTAPGVFDRKDGRALGGVASTGGGYALVAGDVVAAGPGDTAGQLDLSDAKTRQRIVAFGGLHLIAHDGRFYLHSRTQLAAIDRAKYVPLARQRVALQAQLKKLGKRKDAQSKAERARLTKEITDRTAAMKTCWLWRTPCTNPYALILAGDTLFAGGEGRVVAHRADDGRPTWSANVAGRAYGLAVAGGRLLVSTNLGAITCFEHGSGGRTSNVFSPRTPTEPSALPSPYPTDKWTPLYEQAAAAALKQCGASKGFCLVLDAGTGRLALEIAKRSDLRVVGIERDAEKVAAARRCLSRVGAYGKRIVVHHVAGDGGRLPYPPYFANLIVSDAAVAGGALPAARKEILRVLRPCGGVVCIGRPGATDAAQMKAWLAASKWDGADARIVKENGAWAVVRRGPLPGAGQWTHGLADPGNTACSKEQRVAGRLQVQWFGRPGPREMADRHHRNVSPLVKDGRLFVPGDGRIIAVDAYNGAELWQREIPNSRRLGAFLDSSNMAVGDAVLYFVAQATCHQFDVATGETLRKTAMPQLVRGETRHWGYLAPAGGLLVGSGRRRHAAYFRQSRKAEAALWKDKMSLVASDYLFALDPAGGQPRWTYKSGLILNTTLAIGGGRIYFIESHSPKALADKLGRMPMVTFLDGPNHLVALDLETGRTLWKKQADLANCRHIAYINYSAEKLILSGNKYVGGRLWYFFWGIDADSGKIMWHRSHNSGYKPGGGHGEQNRHPTIVGDTVYTYPLAYKLHTGKVLEGWKFSRHGHGCGNVSASAHSLFWRGGNPWRWDLAPGGQASKVNSVTRTGCWINIIPAGGMLLIPEASSGCTCPYPLQTSIAYVPAP